MKPIVSSSVHLVARDGQCLAAIVTAIDPPAPPPGSYPLSNVALTAFPGAVNVSPVPYSEMKNPGTWHWPEPADPIGQEQQT